MSDQMSQQRVKATVISAVKARLDSLGFTEGKVAWPNRKFEPDGTAPWAQFWYFPSDPRTVTLGDNGEEELTGFAQIDINIPTGVGDKVQNDILNALELYFQPGRYVVYQGQGVTFIRATRANAMMSNNFWKIPLTIDFRARYPRQSLTDILDSDYDFVATFEDALSDTDP